MHTNFKKLGFITFLAVASSSGFPQGVLNFANFGNGANAPVFDTDGTTKLAGTNYAADIYWANGIVMDSCALQPLQSPCLFSSVPSEAGFFFGGPRTIASAPGSTITAQVRVWPTAAGSSWLDAGCAGGYVGASALFLVTLVAPSDGAGLTNLQSFTLQPRILTPLVWIQNITLSINQVAFNIVPNTLMPVVVVESTTNLTNSIWSPVQTYRCVACPICFSDVVPTNNPARFYRVGWRMN